jgi:hypothetical protein
MAEPELERETRKQAVERRLHALEVHIQDLEERLRPVLSGPVPAWQWSGSKPDD